MNENIKKLRGSEKRDTFKWAHKNKMSNAAFYASDADLVLIAPYPPGIVAYLDYKSTNDVITFTEKILYDEWAINTSVYIVVGDNPEDGPFDIKLYTPGGVLIDQCHLGNWNDFLQWEAQLRRDYIKDKKI